MTSHHARRAKSISPWWTVAFAWVCLACANTPSEHAVFDLRAEVITGNFSAGLNNSDSLHFRQAPTLEAMTFADERRQAVVTGPGTWRWQGRVPEGGRLRVGFHPIPKSTGKSTSSPGPVTATLVLRDGQQTEVLEVLRAAAAPGSWQDLDLDLSRWRGREVRLEFKTHGPGYPSAARPEVAWAPVRITTGSPPLDGRPNVLLIVVDTLRRDRLGCYGYERPTSPFIDRELAEQGVTLTGAYAQASATLPSVASLVTSRHFGELMQDDEISFALPSELSTLPEKMAGLGYTTAGFVGNALLNAGVGFARGFDTYYSQPDAGVHHPDAADLTGRALDWIEAHAEERFFLYLHLMDPHAPYDNPDIVNGRTPFCPIPEGQTAQDPCPRSEAYAEGAGRLHEMRTAGSAEHSSSFGHPEALAHLNALYDSEVRYMDRHLGKLLAGIPPRVLANTLIILTADHGEELLDHGWWGHGRTTFEELVRVPFIARWDGHIPAGVRLDDTVRLLDLTPTLVAAAGGTPEPSWDGTDLLPGLKGQSPLPRLAAFSQHGYRGPTKAMTVVGDRKLMLFNRAADWDAPNPALAAVHELDRETLPRQALFDLDSDPAETTNLLASPHPVEPSELAALERKIHLQLEAQITGLRIIASGLATGVQLVGHLQLEPPPAEVQTYFLDEADLLELTDSGIRFRITGDGFDKGFIVPGAPGTIHRVEAKLDDQPLKSTKIRLGDGLWTGQPTAASGLRLASGWPQAAEAAALYLWFGSGPSFEPDGVQDVDAARRRLEALGYL